MALVEQFCSWSAWRMNRTSSACSSVLFGVYFTSVALNIMFRKFAGIVRSVYDLVLSNQRASLGSVNSSLSWFSDAFLLWVEADCCGRDESYEVRFLLS